MYMRQYVNYTGAARNSARTFVVILGSHADMVAKVNVIRHCEIKLASTLRYTAQCHMPLFQILNKKVY